ncbi:glycosyltransferase family 61 protein [Azospirillum sp. SYSU D00513]|uniref:glycosyltransferase family 61 protein n=1 Tax=Azospirillum sp. SYSU D00513 TaxID=2812561 RepID=UPI001A95E84A|nr:glycosyltransferase family 61 protein [Azospirillum sp. SYSU D00513]
MLDTVLIGSVDVCTRDRVAGWVANKADPAESFSVEILVDGSVVSTVRANIMRNDLVKVGYGPHGFEFKLRPHHFQPGGGAVVEVRVADHEWTVAFGKHASGSVGRVHQPLEVVSLYDVPEQREAVPFEPVAFTRQSSITVGAKVAYAHPDIPVFGVPGDDPEREHVYSNFRAVNEYMPPARCFFFRGALVGPTGAVITDNRNIALETVEGGWDSQGFATDAEGAVYFTDFGSLAMDDYVAEPVVAIQKGGFANYALWLTECLPRAFIASRLLGGAKPKIMLRTARMPSRAIMDRCLKTLAMIGIEQNDIIIRNNRWDRVADLYVPIVTDPRLQRRVSPAFAECIAALLEHQGLRPKPWRKIYVSRRDASIRRVSNEEALMEALAPHGFELICPGDLSFEDQIKVFSEAEIVVGPHGAGMANVAFMTPGTKVVEIFSRTVLERRPFRDISLTKGLRYCAVVSPDRSLPSHSSDFTVAPPSVMQAVEFIDA